MQVRVQIAGALVATTLAIACSTPDDGRASPPDDQPAMNPAPPRAQPELQRRVSAVQADYDKGHVERAREALAPLVDAFPDSEQLHHLWLEVHAEDPDARLEEIRRWLGIHPESAPTWWALAQCLLDPDLKAGREPAVAVLAARTALERNGAPEASYLVTLGTAHYLNGEPAQAIAAYERALQAAAEGQGTLEPAAVTDLKSLLSDLESESRK